MLKLENLKKTADGFYYLFDYHPYSLYVPNDIDKKIMDIKSKPVAAWQVDKKERAMSFFKNEIVKVIKFMNEELVIVVVPSSKVNNLNQGIRLICKKLCQERGFIDGTNCLVRTRDVESQHMGGLRDEHIHFSSIELEHKDIIKGKNVLLVDDVITTGGTLRACKQILNTGKPKTIYAFAIGKTIEY